MCHNIFCLLHVSLFISIYSCKDNSYFEQCYSFSFIKIILTCRSCTETCGRGSQVSTRAIQQEALSGNIVCFGLKRKSATQLAVSWGSLSLLKV